MMIYSTQYTNVTDGRTPCAVA